MIRTQLSLSDEWSTEESLYEFLCNKYEIHPTIDLAANHDNTKCFHFFDKSDDALSREWNTCSCDVPPKEDLNDDRWLNGPHSKTKSFVLKAHEQWLKHNINILMLVPLQTIGRIYFNKIFDDYIKPNKGVEWHRVQPRPTFIHPDQEKQENAKQEYIVIIWRKRKQ